ASTWPMPWRSPCSRQCGSSGSGPFRPWPLVVCLEAFVSTPRLRMGQSHEEPGTEHPGRNGPRNDCFHTARVLKNGGETPIISGCAVSLQGRVPAFLPARAPGVDRDKQINKRLD